jgi:integrase
MPRKPRRSKRGSVSVSTRNDMLRLRWTHQGRPFQLALGLPDSPLNRHKADILASEIAADIAREQFDPTLAKYKPQPEPEPPPPALTTADLFEQFIEHRRGGGTSGQAIASRYTALLSNLKRHGQDITTPKDAAAFLTLLRGRQSPLVANQNLSLLKGFGAWCVEQGHLLENPWASLPRLKESTPTNPKRQPLTADQIRTVLEATKADRYAAHYHDFVMTLFYLGVRPSEAAGLRWRHIDLERGIVNVAESLSRGADGKSAGWARQRKGTKTNKARTLTLHPNLAAVLAQRRHDDAQPDDLVFLTPRGNAIDDHAFSQRIWKRICGLVGLERVPYSARHSLGSHLLEQGASIPQVAATLGNTPETTARHYAHMIDRPEMPGF